MSNRNIIRAWKNPAYRNSLSEAERAALPANPAGSIEISDEDLGKVAGGRPRTDTNVCTMFDKECTFLCTRFTCPTYWMC